MGNFTGWALIFLAIVQFVFSCFYFYMAKKRIKKVTEEDVEKNRPRVSINAHLLVDGHDYKKFVNFVNLYIDSTNKTNKNINIATAVVTIVAGVITFFSGMILIIN